MLETCRALSVLDISSRKRVKGGDRSTNKFPVIIGPVESRRKNRDILSLSITKPERVSMTANRCRRGQKRVNTRSSGNSRMTIVDIFGPLHLPAAPSRPSPAGISR